MLLDGRRIHVDVFITVYGEDLEVIRRTVAAAVAMRGEHRTWVLDDGDRMTCATCAAELGAWYVRRLSTNGAKAGNVNHALSIAKRRVLRHLRRRLRAEPRVPVRDRAVLHRPTTSPSCRRRRPTATCTPRSPAAPGYMQSVFYRFIQPGRNRFNAAFCVGTNVIFRRDARSTRSAASTPIPSRRTSGPP